MSRTDRARDLTVAERREIMSSFFGRRPGDGGAGPGLGRALIDFQEWEVSSGRIAGAGGSAWWATVNGILLLDMSESSDSGSAGDDPWELYGRADPDEAQARLWEAHQWSIERGVAAAEALLADETGPEQRFIALALEMVGRSAEIGYPTDTDDLGRQTEGLYPAGYPCSEVELASIEATLAEFRA